MYLLPVLFSSASTHIHTWYMQIKGHFLSSARLASVFCLGSSCYTHNGHGASRAVCDKTLSTKNKDLGVTRLSIGYKALEFVVPSRRRPKCVVHPGVCMIRTVFHWAFTPWPLDQRLQQQRPSKILVHNKVWGSGLNTTCPPSVSWASESPGMIFPVRYPGETPRHQA